MPSNHLILCHPFFSCPQSFPASEFFKIVSSLQQVAKVLEFQLQHQTFQEHPGLISFRMDWSQSWRSSIQSAETRLGAGCGSDHELSIAKFRFKLKKGKITRPFRYGINQIPYNYTVEVINRFKGLDLLDRVPKERWIQVCDFVQEAVIKTFPKKK